MTELTDLSLTAAKSALERGSCSAVELVDAHIRACEAAGDLNAFITETFEAARQEASASDARRAKGEAGLLEGLPIANKDLFCSQGVETTAGSRILKGFVPPYESSVSAQLKAEGAISLGKLNLDEFAMGSANTTSYFGPAVNPWSGPVTGKRVPGGSSGGSAAAVAARLVLAATGTDTGGSIRQPAAFCGIVGLKPTYGRCSRYGIIAFASSLDQAGPLTRSVEDAALMLQAMAGYDPKDSTSVDQAVPDYRAGLEGYDLRGKTIGLPKEYRVEGMPESIETLWQQGANWLTEQGAEVVEVSLPHTRYALPCYYVIAPAEASSNLARYDGVRYGLRIDEAGDLDAMYAATRAAGFGAEVKRRLMIGTYVLSAGYYDAYYNKARQVRQRIAEDFRSAFARVDALLTPTAPSAAFALDAPPQDPVTMYLNDVFTVPASLAGLPAISLPAGLDAEGLPLGLQLIGQPFAEAALLGVAQRLEQAAAFNARPPQPAGGHL